MTLTDHKKATGKTWARIAAEIAEHAKANDPDKMVQFYEGRIYAIRAGKKPHHWEVRALYDYLGEGATFY